MISEDRLASLRGSYHNHSCESSLILDKLLTPNEKVLADMILRSCTRREEMERGLLEAAYPLAARTREVKSGGGPTFGTAAMDAQMSAIMARMGDPAAVTQRIECFLDGPFCLGLNEGFAPPPAWTLEMAALAKVIEARRKLVRTASEATAALTKFDEEHAVDLGIAEVLGCELP